MAPYIPPRGTLPSMTLPQPTSCRDHGEGLPLTTHDQGVKRALTMRLGSDTCLAHALANKKSVILKANLKELPFLTVEHVVKQFVLMVGRDVESLGKYWVVTMVVHRLSFHPCVVRVSSIVQVSGVHDDSIRFEQLDQFLDVQRARKVLHLRAWKSRRLTLGYEESWESNNTL
jgi:hypothetical protein